MLTCKVTNSAGFEFDFSGFFFWQLLLAHAGR